MFEADRAEAAAGNSALLHLTCCCKRDLDDGEAVRHGHVCVFSVTLWLLLIDRGRTRGKENDRFVWFPHLSNTIPAHPSCNNPRGASAKSQTETLTWKINNLPYAVGYLVYIAAPYSAKRVTLLVSVLADDVHWDAFEESLYGRKWNGINRSFNESFSNRD